VYRFDDVIKVTLMGVFNLNTIIYHCMYTKNDSERNNLSAYYNITKYKYTNIFLVYVIGVYNFFPKILYLLDYYYLITIIIYIY